MVITIPSAIESTKVEVQILQVSMEEDEDESPAYCVDFKRIEGSEIVYSDEVARYLQWFEIDMDDEEDEDVEADENEDDEEATEEQIR